MVDGVDLRALPLTPMEGFVVSRIDGSATVQDLSDLTSLDPEQVHATIEKLIGLGAAEWADGSMGLPRASMRPATPAEGINRSRFAVPQAARAPLAKPNVTESRPPEATREPAALRTPPPRVPFPTIPPEMTETVDTERTRSAVRPEGASAVATGARVGMRAEKPVEKPADRRASPPPPAASPPAAAAADDIDLPPERRKRIDEIYPVLELMDHYEILGVERSADVKAIRAAYFELSKVFHPDTAFRKNLGGYKAKMEAIFKSLTEAYDVLGKKKSRAEYDAYLGLQTATREAEAMISAVASAPPPSAPVAAPAIAPPPPATPPTPPPPVAEPRAQMSEEGKRRARELLEMRLGTSRPAPRPGSPPPAEPPASSSPPRERSDVLRDLASSLKGAAAQTGGIEGGQRHVLEAKRLEQAGDLAGAARELRMAVALAPERFDVAQEQQRVAKLLAGQLAGQYRQQAEYEERHRKWAAAALSWAKVVEGQPDDREAHVRAANALVEAKGDLHKAQRFAQRACELGADDAVARRTLGRVFVAAGLQLNARRELEKAAALDPSDEIVKNLLRELKG